MLWRGSLGTPVCTKVICNYDYSLYKASCSCFQRVNLSYFFPVQWIQPIWCLFPKYAYWLEILFQSLKSSFFNFCSTSTIQEYNSPTPQACRGVKYSLTHARKSLHPSWLFELTHRHSWCWDFLALVREDFLLPDACGVGEFYTTRADFSFRTCRKTQARF